MKTFCVIDWNKPGKFLFNCTGCVLEPKKMDQLIVVTEAGDRFEIGPQIPHDLGLRLYKKVLETAMAGGTIELPDMAEMNDDAIRVLIEELKPM